MFSPHVYGAILAASSLTLYPSGWINTTGGSGFLSSPLSVGAGDVIEAFEVQWVGWNVSPSWVGTPASLSAAIFSTELGPLPFFTPKHWLSIGFTSLGQVNEILPGTAFDELMNLVAGSTYSPRFFYGEVNYGFGGVNISGEAILQIRALGTDARSVPVPNAFMLALLGCALLKNRFQRGVSKVVV